MRRPEPRRHLARFLAGLAVLLWLLPLQPARAAERARAMPSLGLALGYAWPYEFSDLQLEPALASGVKFQIGDRRHTGLAPYFYLLVSQHRIRSLTPNLDELVDDDADDPYIDPKVRLALLNRRVRLTMFGVGLGYLLIDDWWIQPYVDVGLGGGALGFSGEVLEALKPDRGGVAIHAALGADVFFYRGFAVGVDLRTAHLFTDNPFDRDAPARGISLLCLTANLKYWDR